MEPRLSSCHRSIDKARKQLGYDPKSHTWDDVVTLMAADGWANPQRKRGSAGAAGSGTTTVLLLAAGAGVAVAVLWASGGWRGLVRAKAA